MFLLYLRPRSISAVTACLLRSCLYLRPRSLPRSRASHEVRWPKPSRAGCGGMGRASDHWMASQIPPIMGGILCVLYETAIPSRSDCCGCCIKRRSPHGIKKRGVLVWYDGFSKGYVVGSVNRWALRPSIPRHHHPYDGTLTQQTSHARAGRGPRHARASHP